MVESRRRLEVLERAGRVKRSGKRRPWRHGTCWPFLRYCLLTEQDLSRYGSPPGTKSERRALIFDMTPSSAEGRQFLEREITIEGPAVSPLTLNSKLLGQLNILPDIGDPSQEASAPVGAFLDYSDEGLRLFSQPEKLLVSESVSKASGEESRIYKIAADYAATFPRPAYHSLKLTWRLSVERPDAHEWLLRTFLSAVSWRKEPYPVVHVHPRLRFETPDGACILWLSSSASKGSPEQQERIEISSDFRHGGPLDSLAALEAAIQKWPQRKIELTQILDAIGLR